MHTLIDRIEINPKIMGGKPIKKGTRIPIYIILTMLRDGASFDKIIEAYPRLEKEDIKAVLDYSIYLANFDEEIEIHSI